MAAVTASHTCHPALGWVLWRSARVTRRLRSRCRVPNGVAAAPPTAWVDARRLEPRWPSASALKPPSRFCSAARNASADLMSAR
jgi:hypothetical protein